MSRDCLRLGIPSKGRLAEQVEELLRQGGLRFRRQLRSLFARVPELPVEIAFLRTDDIPVLCAEDAIDLGITGADLVVEAAVDVEVRLRLGLGRCRLAVCVPEASRYESVEQLAGHRIATSFPEATRRFFQNHGVDVHLVTIRGSVEIMTALGVADGIVDLVETGSTLAAHKLRVLGEIGEYETVLIQNRVRRHGEVADRVVRRLEGVVIAREYSLLEYNIPRERLAQAEQIAPGFHSPTISSLEDSAWCAVRVMVRRRQVIDVMEQLESLGATAILETPIANCRL